MSEISDRYIKLAGSVTSSTKIHSVVLFDSDKAFGNYWSRSYRAPVDLAGSFALKVDEPFAAASGNLSLFFCTEDGRNTGTGNKEVLTRDVFSFSYTGMPGSRVFTRN